MGWSTERDDLVPYPSPYRARNVYHPYNHRDYRDYRTYPYPFYRSRSRSRSLGRGGRGIDEFAEAEKKWERSAVSLRDPNVRREGDLGWTLDYATAWAYRNLIGNQTEVTDAIDRVRQVGRVQGVKAHTPFIIFDYLSRALFGGKLGGMVHLRWKRMASLSPGITSAPGAYRGVPRVCIELNKLPFEDCGAHIDDLLDALVHHMIHAYFLVACGAQPKTEKQDGRLQDGLHFGVLLYTIRDLTLDSRRGPLDFTFYAADRRRLSVYAHVRHQLPNKGRRFIGMEPKGTAVTAAPMDGQTHCHHDNRKITYAEIKNWQIEGYSVALDLGLDSKGDTVWDYAPGNELVEVDRLRAPPSSEYIELIWDNKRVMVQRCHALKYASIKKPLEKDNKMELKLPDCSKEVFTLIYDYFNKKSYATEPDVAALEGAAMYQGGPPVLSGQKGTKAPNGVIVQLQVFKAAESMKFEELQGYVLDRLWQMPYTNDDPLEIIKQLYNEKDGTGPIHSVMLRWARDFLGRINEDAQWNDLWYGNSFWYEDIDFYTSCNLYKICTLYPAETEELIGKNLALKDDCRLVWAQILAKRIDPVRFNIPRPAIATKTPVATITESKTEKQLEVYAPGRVGRSRSVYDALDNWRSPWAVSESVTSYDDSWLDSPRWSRYGGRLRDRRDPLYLPSSAPYSYYSRRDGRRKFRDSPYGDTWARYSRARWD